MSVGGGASRVPDVLANGKKNDSCFIFINDMHDVGRQRAAGITGGNDERIKTVNHMLTQKDGFKGKLDAIFITGTNHVDVVAIGDVRPGSFNRRIVLYLLNIAVFLEILNLHAQGKLFTGFVDLDHIARRTTGF